MKIIGQLNAGQQAAAEGFFEFLFSDATELIISGPGGVGKTFLMGHLIDDIIPKYHEICKMMNLPPVYHSVQMTATTNKAAEVLGKATGRPTSTIHSHLGIQVFRDFKTGATKLTKGKKWRVQANQILFVDEASMIDSHLHRLIREGTYKCKIVYVGDHCQLAPVMEKLSPIYESELSFYELTEPMRNADQPALMEICNQLRRTVETGKFEPICMIPGVIDHLEPEQMEKEIEAHFGHANARDRILAYTNRRVVAYNDHIRALRGLPDTFVEGEIVVNNSAIFFNGQMMSVEDEFAITAVGPRQMHEIEPGVELEVMPCNLSGDHTDLIGVPVPVDRQHFDALVKHYAKQKDWLHHYQLKDNYPDLRPRDAATVHKAQGSTYDTVFIDLEDLSTCRQPAEAARLLYVAFSRARRRVVTYGDLAPKYGGIIR